MVVCELVTMSQGCKLELTHQTQSISASQARQDAFRNRYELLISFRGVVS